MATSADNNRWEREMPKAGDDHNKMILSLKTRGICAEAQSVHEVADKIWNYIYEKLDRWIPFQPFETALMSPSGPSENSLNTGNESFLTAYALLSGILLI